MLTHDYLLRDLEVSGRTLVLACVPFMQPEDVSDDGQHVYREQFAHGAFAKVARDPARTRLYRTHLEDPLNDLGHATALREDQRYLVGEFPVKRTDRGDHMLQLVADGDYRGVSVGFIPGRSEEIDGVVTRTHIRQLPHVALVPEPAYTGAEVLAVRHKQQAAAREREWWRWHHPAR